jgi:CxxC-x17-CxxC domain-containing protein
MEFPSPQVDKIIPAEQLPESIDDIPDDVLNWAIRCSATKRPFRIVRKELEFYRRMHLPLPRFHPEERHRRRTARRHGRQLFARTCAKCGKAIQTSYSPERSEIVYCEECYLKEVY